MHAAFWSEQIPPESPPFAPGPECPGHAPLSGSLKSWMENLMHLCEIVQGLVYTLETPSPANARMSRSMVAATCSSRSSASTSSSPANWSRSTM